MSLRLFSRVAFGIALIVVIGASLLPMAWMTDGWPGYDKVWHLTGYFALAILAAVGWPRWRGAALIGLPLVGLGLEVAQNATGRQFDWGDALTNAAGIGIAVALSTVVARLLDRG